MNLVAGRDLDPGGDSAILPRASVQPAHTPYIRRTATLRHRPQNQIIRPVEISPRTVTPRSEPRDLGHVVSRAFRN